jgi:hypothetical protein
MKANSIFLIEIDLKFEKLKIIKDFSIENEIFTTKMIAFT